MELNEVRHDCLQNVHTQKNVLKVCTTDSSWLLKYRSQQSGQNHDRFYETTGFPLLYRTLLSGYKRRR